jgi:peptidoglycan-associated lipoprotein
MNNTTRILLAALMCTAAVACSKKVKEAPPASTPVAEPPAATEPAPSNGMYTPADLDTDACLRTRVIYFDFDQDALRPEFQQAMACHAKYLRDRPSSRMTLEGNADERGSREYNMGLGERRGNAVSSALQANGGNASQVSVVSYGEERPTCTESSEDCWAKNRRVEIVYTEK